MRVYIASTHACLCACVPCVRVSVWACTYVYKHKEGPGPYLVGSFTGCRKSFMLKIKIDLFPYRKRICTIVELSNSFHSESSVIVTIMRFVYNAPLSVCRRTYIVRLRIVSLKVTSSWWPDAELFISQNNPQQPEIAWMKEEVTMTVGRWPGRVFLVIGAVWDTTHKNHTLCRLHAALLTFWVIIFQRH